MRNTTNDITYCTNKKCQDKECFRNIHNICIHTTFPYISEADFTDCPNWKEQVNDNNN